MPTIYDPNATYWLEVPTVLSGYHETYYSIVGSQVSVRERPKVPWDQLWVVYTHNQKGCERSYYYNKVSGQTVWQIPGVLRKSGKVGAAPQWPSYRAKKEHEWDMQMVIPFPEYVAHVYDPDVTSRAVSACLRDAAQEEGIDDDMSNKGAWVLKIGVAQRGKMQTAYAWNRRSGEVAKALPQGVVPSWTAYPVVVTDSAGATWLAEYYVDGAGNKVWALPADDKEEAAGEHGDDTLPRWMCPGSAVRLAMLPTRFGRLEGICGTVEHIDAGKVRLRFPDFFGPDYHTVEAGWVAPLRPGTVATLTRMQPGQQPRDGESVTVQGFDAISQVYTVKAGGEEAFLVQSWQLKPCAPLRDLLLKQPVQELAWKKDPEQQVEFIDRSGKPHSCSVHLPFGWDAWMARRDRSPWPLLIHLHGHGCNASLLHATKKSVKSPGINFAAEHFVVVSPSCEWDWRHDPHGWVVELVESLRACQWIDADRVYLAGCSMGGMGAWMIGARRPDLFAAIAPIAAYHKPQHEAFIASRLKGLPIAVAASAVDVVCPFSEEIPLLQRLQEEGCRTLQVFLHESVTHERMWEKAFCETEFLYHWLLAHCRH